MSVSPKANLVLVDRAAAGIATPKLPPWRGWPPLLLLPAIVLLFTPATWPRWLFMWLLAFAIYFGCKWLTWRRTPISGLSWLRHIGYLLAWPGLDAVAFLSPQPPPIMRPTRREWLFATAKTLGGVAVFWSAGCLIPPTATILLGWCGMIGLAFMLHFGVFHLLSCFWRSLGVEAVPLMNHPWAATSVSEFWGKRWNLAFRDLTHRFLFRPLANRLGPRWGIAAVFVFSGVVHDVVISVPSGGGYGGPTLFFLIQLGGLFAERSRLGRNLGLGSGWRGWLFTAMILLGPAALLFHEPFLRNVVVPFMQALGAANGPAA
jgi:hypothetical protein